MKKLLALLLAALLASLGAAALAAEAAYDPDDQSTWRTEPTAFTFTATYVGDAGAAASVFPAEALTFTVEKAAGNTNPDDTMITVNDARNTYTATGAVNTVTVNVPAYSRVGKYVYTITQNPGAAQGVGRYDATPINVAVFVTFDYEKRTLDVEAGVEKAGADAQKADALYNTYGVGGLTVSKTVAGNLGDKAVAFDIDVTFRTEAGKTVWSDITYSGGTDAGTQAIARGWTGESTVTVHLKHGDSVAFENIPAGVTYAVAEQAKHAEPGLNDPAKGYAAAYANGDNDMTDAGSGAIAAGDQDTVAITNTKGTGVNTGVSLDSLPYVIALAVVAVGAVLFILRRRRKDD